MTPWTTDRLVGTGLTGAVELFLLWKIWRSLRQGTVSVTFGNNMPSESFLNLVADRDELPIYYWLLMVVLGLGAVVMGGFVALIAGGFVA